jgi:hypothetical protein
MKEGTPETGGEAAEQAGNGNDENASDSDDESKAVEAIQLPRTLKKSEYELTRDANIAKNKELLLELEAKHPSAEIGKDASELKVKKGKKKHGRKQIPTRSSTRIQGPR